MTASAEWVMPRCPSMEAIAVETGRVRFPTQDLGWSISGSSDPATASGQIDWVENSQMQNGGGRDPGCDSDNDVGPSHHGAELRCGGRVRQVHVLLRGFAVCLAWCCPLLRGRVGSGFGFASLPVPATRFPSVSALRAQRPCGPWNPRRHRQRQCRSSLRRCRLLLRPALRRGPLPRVG